MKKILSIALVLSLLFVSLCSFPVSAASGNFAAPENWKVYNGSSTALNEQSATVSWASVTENTDSTYANGDSSSLKLNSIYQYAVLPINVKKNTDYTLSYKFYSDAETPATSSSYQFLINKTGIISPSHNVSPWNAERTYYDFITYNTAFSTPDGLFANKTDDSRRTTDWVESGKWHSVNLSFNSNNDETVMLAIYSSVSNIYVDDVVLNEMSSFEQLGNWGIYKPNSTAAGYTATPNFDGESCQTKMSWCTITNDTAVDADSTGKSIKIYGNTFNVAVNLPKLKANTEYTLNFKYKPSAETTTGVTSNTYYFLSHIIKKGVGFNQWNSGPETYVATVPSGTATTDWKDVSVTFTTDDTTDYMLEFYFGFGAGYTLYLDGFVLEEPHPQLNDWRVLDPNNTVYVNENDAALTASWATVTTCNDKNYIKDGDSSSLKIHATNQMAVYKFPVEKNAKYIVSYNFMSQTVAPNGRIITSTGILAANSSTKWAAEKSYYNFMSYNTAYKAPGGVFADKTQYSDKTTNYTTANIWNHIELEFESGNNEYMYLAIVLAVDDLYIDGITVTLDKSNIDKVTTAYNNAAALRTANASSIGKNGLRVYNSISKSYLNTNNVVEYGSLASFADYLNGEEITLETDKTLKGVAYNSTTQITPILYDQTDDTNIFTAYLTNIPKTHYDKEIVVRAYVIEEDGTVHYGETITVCVFDIAYAIDCGNSADSSAQTNDDIAAFEAFANFDGSYCAYDAWLTANGKTAGALRNPA